VPAGGLDVTGLTLRGGSSFDGLIWAPVASLGMFFGDVADIFFFSWTDYPIFVECVKLWLLFPGLFGLDCAATLDYLLASTAGSVTYVFGFLLEYVGLLAFGFG